MNETISHFLKHQTCATICLLEGNGNPYCFNCFYAFNSENGLLYFKSPPDAYHSGLIKTNQPIAGTVLPDKLNFLLTKGVQFSGIALNEKDPLTDKASLLYHKRHPLALAINGNIITLRINWIKMTDGTKGTGKKITWGRME
jgi:uncharacterized protein YhbP (UPF0306 family)